MNMVVDKHSTYNKLHSSKLSQHCTRQFTKENKSNKPDWQAIVEYEISNRNIKTIIYFKQFDNESKKQCMCSKLT